MSLKGFSVPAPRLAVAVKALVFAPAKELATVSNPFDFLNPLNELEAKVQELEDLGESTGMDMQDEIDSLLGKLDQATRNVFAGLSPWQRVLLSRHPERLQTSDYIDYMLDDFVPLAGDRAFADDAAIQCGIGKLAGQPVMIIGQQKGKDVHERAKCNFGCPHPEGYRKAMQKMLLAEKFNIPILCLINTPGAFPGVEAEERGQSLAIAENIRDMAMVKVPIIVVVIGEGGSGGALGIGVGDRIILLENSYYSVISPEGCAAILWRDGAKADIAAERLKLTAGSLQDLGIVDRIISEPPGGAHRRPAEMADSLREVLSEEFAALKKMSPEELLNHRYDKFRAIGQFVESA